MAIKSANESVRVDDDTGDDDDDDDGNVSNDNANDDTDDNDDTGPAVLTSVATDDGTLVSTGGPQSSGIINDANTRS